ncbi:ditrans,polycis-undecaprenyl-diphosphate synthase ((2E,6E)-farnesyl-diphosphate specific) [Flavobacteriaceae bacterium UJ101]|nr:ditrans,polycis-undecaprenyl-diphosphate synthase ((2E,6E)-farnesyl-diphosphate specific) [Flavobacteriaceae bacterium UJ101]
MNLLLDKIDFNNIPQHIAIIMDGNGRWAKKRGLLRTSGHKNGIKSVKNAMEACEQIGVKYLTLYAFSSENWNRPKKEVNMLMKLLVSTLRKEVDEFNKNNIRLNIIGNKHDLPLKVQKELQEALELTKDNTKAILTIALSYGSHDEILEAVKKIASDVKDEKLSIQDINKEILEANLYTYNLPPVDLLIRTSGEQRISNFLLWQIAYAELYFTDVLWPDFQRENLYEAVLNYQDRERRYGKTSEQLV